MPSNNLPRMGEVDFIYPTLSRRHWDIVLTCFEPLQAVTGGIGSYHRLLIEQLSLSGLSILILTRSINKDYTPPVGGTVFLVDTMTTRAPFNFVGLDHQHFALQCYFALQGLHMRGDIFGLTEFSDYGGDGFYALRAHRAGALDLGVTAVRLHSPQLMLVEDNGGHMSSLDSFGRDVLDRELSAYEDCDLILYGGDAMRDRVAELADRFGTDLNGKMVKCPHPYPKHLFSAAAQTVPFEAASAETVDAIMASNSHAKREDVEKARLVGIFGRIEDRKGQYQLISGLLRNAAFVDWLRSSDVHFVIAGHNVLDHIGNFFLGDLYDALYRLGLSDRFHFTGRVSQDVLAHFSRAVSGYIFPSIFENYPNALLEILPTTKPILISERGCMGEITKGFTAVNLFDPLHIDPEQLRDFLDGLPRGGEPADEHELSHRIATLESRQSELIGFYGCWAASGKAALSQRPAPGPDPSIGFVVPVYQVWKYLDDTLASIQKCQQPGDRVVVVDDASSREALEQIERICAKRKVEILRAPINAGPAEARRRGVAALDTDLIQFCDADDLLNPQAIAAARQAFARDPDLTLLNGIMHCFQEADYYWVPRNGHSWTAFRENFAHSGSTFRREAIAKALAVPHERLPRSEDWLTNLLILAHGGKARMLPLVTYQYRRFPGTRSTQNISLEAAVNRRIVTLASEQWQFSHPGENQRIRYFLPRSGLASTGIAALFTEDIPLRYQLIDRLYYTLIRFSVFRRLADRLRPGLISRLRHHHGIPQ